MSSRTTLRPFLFIGGSLDGVVRQIETMPTGLAKRHIRIGDHHYRLEEWHDFEHDAKAEFYLYDRLTLKDCTPEQWLDIMGTTQR